MAEKHLENGVQGQNGYSDGGGPVVRVLPGETGSGGPGESSTETRWNDWLVLHQALLAGDKVARSLVAERYMEYVKRVLKSLIPEVEDELLTDATTDALMNYFLHPERFDPSKRSLPSYLVMSAKGDLLNIIEKRDNRRRREIVGNDGELETNGRNDLYEEDTELWDEIRRNFSAEDLAAIRMMSGGVKSYEEYARIWGIDCSNVLDMRREVKRRKTQLKRALVRIYSKWKGSSDG